ncbi:MAG: phospholipase D family protein [Steroidobacteraceae bacterium]
MRAYIFAAPLCLVIACATGCVGLPPAASLPKTVSSAIDPGLPSRLERIFAPMAAAHHGDSGFRILAQGLDGLAVRLELIDAAQRSLDVQSYIFRADESGSLVADALLRAAARGVRIRVVVDDGETVPGDERILSLAAAPNIEVRIFNPLTYRGHNKVLRAAELLFAKARVDYRMHNKLMVADNNVALIGGRNIGNQYFQIDRSSQFGDDDVIVVGPTVPKLAAIFDKFWADRLTVPAQAVDARHASASALAEYRPVLEGHRLAFLTGQAADLTGQTADDTHRRTPLADVIQGRASLTWAQARIVYDSPDKKDVANGGMAGHLIYKAVEAEAAAVSSELLVITPFLVPSADERAVLAADRARNVRVRILTNSLKACPTLAAQAGYMRYRPELLQEGIELYEVRALLGSGRGSGQSKAISRHGNYALHAKLFVFDRKSLFVGSMNLDERSKHINTEIGLLIFSPPLAGEIAARFDQLTRLDNSYTVNLGEQHGGRTPRSLTWTTEEAGTVVHYRTEPARSPWQKFKVTLLRALPLDKEL